MGRRQERPGPRRGGATTIVLAPFARPVLTQVVARPAEPRSDRSTQFDRADRYPRADRYTRDDRSPREDPTLRDGRYAGATGYRKTRRPAMSWARELQPRMSAFPERECEPSDRQDGSGR